MSYDKQNLMEDAEDEGLKAVMGSRFQDVSKEGSTGETAAKATPQSRCSRDSSAQGTSFCRPYTGEPLGAEKDGKAKRNRAAVDAEYTELPTYAPNWFDRLKGCARYALVCGSLVALFGYWHISGQMDASAAVPCMVACGTIGGFKIGNVCRR